MSSLEEPLGRLLACTTSACRPRVDQMEMGNCLTEGRQCSSSKNCNEKYAWKRQPRDVFYADPLISRSPCIGRSQRAFSSLCDSLYLHDRRNSSCNDMEMRDLANKFLRGMPRFVKIVEVGPRDGLQNENSIIPTTVKVELIQKLVSSGLLVVEATSFVSPKWVPQLADAKDVVEAIQNIEGVRFPVLTPNLKGFKAAVAAGAKEIAIFASASESFSMSNLNCNIKDSLARYREVAIAAKELAMPVRGWKQDMENGMEKTGIEAK